MIVAGIDPGLDGAIAFTDTDDLNLTVPDGVYDMPTVTLTMSSGKTQRVVSALRLRLLIAQHHPDRVYVEQTWGQGASRGSAHAAFKQGMTYGSVLGVLGGMQIPHTLVTPQRWQKHCGLLGADKDAARDAAMTRWPTHAIRFKRKKDDGRADAALIAAYAVDCEKGLVG